MKHTCITAVIITGCLILAALCQPLQAAQLAIWEFQDSASPSNVVANLSAADATISAGSIGYQNGTDDGGTRIGNSGAWNTGDFDASEKYLQFSVAPDAGYTVTLTNLAIRLGRTSAGPAQFTAQYSLDGFATAGTAAGSGAITSENVNALDAFSLSSLPAGPQPGTVTFRIWGHNASGTGNLRFNNFRIFGTVAEALGSPVDVRAADTNATAFTATWEAVSGADHYRLDVWTSRAYLETFDDSPVSGATYVDGRFTNSVNDVVWNYTQVRSEGDYRIDGKGMMLRRSGENSKLVSDPVAGGILDFAVDLRKAFTGSGARQVELLVNDIARGQSITFGDGSGADDTIHTFDVAGIETTGAVTLELRHITDGDNRQITIDNLAWTSFEPVAGYSNLLVSGTSQLVSGLNPETAYYVRVRAENDEETSPNSVVTNVTTLAPAALSDIVRAADFTEPVGLDYAAFQAASALTTGNSLEVARFSLRDGGADGDDDGLPTTLTSLTLDVIGHANLRRVGLFDGTEKLAEADSAASIQFDDLTVTAADGGLTNLSLRVTFQPSVTDQAPIQFTVTAATAAPDGSSFAAADAGGAASSLDDGRNRISVTATELAFTSLPAAVVIGSNFTVSVEARDLNGNRDLDATDAVSLSLAAGAGTLTGNATQALDEGVYTWTALQLDAGGTFTLRADAAGLSEVVSGAIESGDVLAPGDITILGYRTTNPDGFAFVTWKHISGGTVLGFWDHSANSDGTFRRAPSGEKSMTWTAPAGGLATGRVVVVSCPEGADPATASSGTVEGKLDGLSQSGDQIFAGVGGAFPPDGGSEDYTYTYTGTLLYGLNTHAPWLTTGTPDSNLSYLPAALDGAELNQAFATGVNNGQYTGERQTYTTWAQYRAMIHDPANWSRENEGTTTLDATPFSLGTPADEPTVQATAITFSDVTPYEAMVAWTAGDGIGRVVLCRQDIAPVDLPVDEFPLTAHPVLGGGGSLLGDAQVVYAGTGTQFKLGGLSPTNTYVLQIFEYNGSGGLVNYLTNSATANPAVLDTPSGPPVAPGDILVHLVDGDGSSLSGAAARVRIRQYTRMGDLVNQWDLPSGESGTRLTATGDSDVEGKLAVAPGGAFVAVVGYDATAGTPTVRTNLTRTIGRLNVRAGNWDYTTTGPLGGDNTARAVAVDDSGTNFWAVLHADAAAQQGLRHVHLGQTMAGSHLGARNLRGVRIVGAQLYQYGAAGSNQGVFRVGDGLPIDGTPTVEGLPGISQASDLFTTGFFMADLSDAVEGFDTLWMARYGIGNLIGVTKYSNVGGHWIANSTNLTGSAVVHLDGMVEDGVAHIFIVQGATGTTRLMHLADASGYNQPMTATPVELAASGPHQAFRGVAVIPADANHNGIPDWWELGWFGELDAIDPDAEIGESGVTIRQAYWAGTDPTDPTDVMRITGLDLAEETGDDVTLTFHAGAHRSYVIRAASAADALPDAAATLLTGAGGTLDWTDAGAFADGPRRFYRLSVEHDGGGYTNAQQWAVFRQPRQPGRQELVSVPVHYPDGGDNLNAALGEHLARGLHASDTEGDADKIRWRDGNGAWIQYFLSETHGWTQPGSNATANVELPPGTAVWVVRGSGAAARESAVFAGPVVTPDQAATIAFPTNTWTAAGWPLPTPGRAQRDNTLPDQLGFTNATGGTRGELGDANSGDQLWVWRTGGGWARYWLADNEDEDHPAHRRWFGLNDFADITLQPGDAFYYFNSTNRAAAVNFDWRAEP